jgi:hypothetical protein
VARIRVGGANVLTTLNRRPEKRMIKKNDDQPADRVQPPFNRDAH